VRCALNNIKTVHFIKLAGIENIEYKMRGMESRGQHIQRTYRTVLDVVTVVIIVASTLRLVTGDRGTQTRAFIKCTEPTSSNTDFASNDCNFYTQYQAQVDLIGGGESTATISILGNPGETVINLLEYPNATTVCPQGFACTPTMPDDTLISVIRSPIPSGIPVILPGGAVSLGIAFPLNRYSSTPNNGLPYSYQIATLPSSDPTSQCATLGDATGSVTIQDTITTTPGTGEPSCGVSAIPLATELNGTCGGVTSLAPNPVNHLQDGDGKCRELCCGQDTSVRVRQLGLQCYQFYADQPLLAVDLAVRVKNSNTPENGTILSIFGTLSPNQIVTSSTPGAHGVRARIQSVKSEILRFGSAMQAVAAVQSSAIIACSNNWANVPDESAPVSDVAELEWFYMPTPYLKYYEDGTAADADANKLFPKQLKHPKIYGESGDTVLQNSLEYISSTYANPADQKEACESLSGVLPFTPGYDKDGMLLPEVADYDLPSFCYMQNQARMGNANFLPPNFNTATPNWFVTSGITPVGSDTSSSPEQRYLIYIPTLADIAQVNAQDTLLNALTLSIEVNDKIIAYDGNEAAPTDFSLDPPPTCTLALPSTLEEATATGEGNLWATVRSTLAPGQDASFFDVKETEVAISCTAIVSSGRDGTTPAIQVSPGSISVVTPGDPVRVSFNISATFDAADGGYSQQAVPSVKIALCEIDIISVRTGDPIENVTMTIPCSVGYTSNAPPTPVEGCGVCDLSCGKLYKNVCFWVIIIVALGMAGGITAAGVLGHRHIKALSEMGDYEQKQGGRATLEKYLADRSEQLRIEETTRPLISEAKALT
jgi:hypothetical protein